MDRFFSKLDLRDIKIKPEGSRFLPDDDEGDSFDEHGVAPVSVEEPALDVIESEPIPFAQSPSNGHVVTASYERVTVSTWETTADGGDAEQPYDGTALQTGVEVLKVSAKSRPSAVAGAIAGVVRENGRAEVQAIGAGATNQAVKAIAIAREYLLETNIDAVCVPAFIDVTIDNEERTAIRLVIETR